MTDLPWQPGGARGGDKAALSHGEQFLMCVRLAGRLGGGSPWLDWHVVEIKNDEDGFKFESHGWVWRWEDVEYCLPMSSLKLPEEAKVT